MANYHTVHGVLRFLMSLIGTRRKIVSAGELRRIRELDPNFKSLQRQDCIRSMTGVIRQCGCFQVCLRIQRMILWWECSLLMHWIPLWRVWCMYSGLKTRMLNMMWHTGWSKLESAEQWGGGQNQNSQMGNSVFEHRWRMHNLLISNGMRTSKLNYRPLC